ncbi:hypothetical protein GGR58DRAFT_467145 [Xylaria digitata]|nr:hypothetical protein GGR58DRAFT_467145 [Xylaria digitata]
MKDITQTNITSLAQLYFGCINSFSKFILALSEPDCDVICRDEAQLPQIFEEYGRTKIWGDQNKADLPDRARGSLDDILRHDNDLKSLVCGILQRLEVLLQQATHIARRKYDPAKEIDQDSISSVTDSDCSTDNEDESQRRKMPKIRLLVRQIAEQVGSLHEISSLLRRPTVTNKFIRSVSVGLEPGSLRGLENIPLNGAFEMFDNSHVLEKVLHWRGLSKSLQRINFSDEAVTPVNSALNDQDIHDIRWFCQRLAKANTRRREQLQYWKTHPYDPNQVFISANLVGDLVVPREEDSRSQVSTIKPPNSHASREGPKSVISKQSFSTVALSDVHDTGTNVRPRTIYAPTVGGRDRTISIPAPPKTKDGETTFPCPYCGMKLAPKDMTRQLWKRHVFRDLRPYICTFEHCHNAGKLFSSRHDWKNHEFQIHRREYVCQRCRNRCASRQEMSTHLQGHYGDSIPSAQMNIILDLCDRQVDPSGNHTDSCILCGEEMLLSALYDHVATHMENLSVFVLPAPEDDEEDTQGSVISGRADILDSINDSTGSASEASSLGFSAAEFDDLFQTEFDKIFSEELEYTSKFSAWNATGEDPDDDPARILDTRKLIDGHGQTLFMKACAKGEYEMAKKRLAKSPEDLDFADDAGNTPLQIASLNGHEDIVQLLIESGCNLDCRNIDKETPLLDAVENGHIGVVKLLLKAGVDPREANAEGHEPLEMIPDDLDNAEEIRAALREAKERWKSHWIHRSARRIVDKVTWEQEESRHKESERASIAALGPVAQSNPPSFDTNPNESQTRMPWAVHVSLMPTKTQPFPFEKDTNAYKRCLSRGLYQMVTVGGVDGESFNRAITIAFGNLLRGREWMPLQSRLCDAATLEGLPMLRPLDPTLIGRPYDLEFLRQHCAVCNVSGKIESLYIAMVYDTFSWNFLRLSLCYLDGLEASWEYDPLLDYDDNINDMGVILEDSPPIHHRDTLDKSFEH